MKGNLFLGFGRKKLGDVVFYRSQGVQMARARNRAPKNPKSAAQAVQRMVLATAAKMASAYEPIVNHSFEGTEVGAKSVQEFRSYAMHALRSAAAAQLNDPEGVDRRVMFDIKGAPTIGLLQDLQVSRGSLGMNGYTVYEDNVHIVLQSALATQAFTTQADYEAELKKLGIVPGDQLTFIVHSLNSDEVVAEFAQAGGASQYNYAQRVQFSRVVFKAELPDAFSGTLLSGTAINSALIEESYGILPSFAAGTTSGGGNYLGCDFAGLMDPGFSAHAIGVIRSQIDGGKWKYSTAYMRSDDGVLDVNDAAQIYPSYMENTGTINVGDSLYLRHAVATPFAEGE